MLRLFTIPKVLRGFFGQRTDKPVSLVAERFLQVFLEHGIEISQIPRLLPQVGLDALQSTDRLLATLTPDLLDQVAELFGIRRQWLDGVGEQIYDGQSAYKRPSKLLTHLVSLLAQDESLIYEAPLRILTTTMQLDGSSSHTQFLAPVLLERITDLDDEPIFRYHIYCDGYDWGYYPTRIELKAIARLLFTKLRLTSPLFPISKENMDRILAGGCIPAKLLDGCLQTTPSLEDFALSEKESRIAKEVGEFQDVLDLIDEQHLDEISFAWESLPAPEPTSESVAGPDTTTTAPTPELLPSRKPGKRQRQAEDWQEARTYARACWTEDPSTLIEDMVRRIQDNKTFRVSALSASAIRKHIVDLAPEGIRGKSGRKPKKST